MTAPLDSQSHQDGSLAGKVALVTGASRGIGAAIARKLAQHGARVAVHYRSGRPEAESLAAAVGGFPVQADLSRVETIEPMFYAVTRHFGGLDMVVNNAGVAIMRPVAEATLDEYESIFSLNARAVFFCCQQAAKCLPDGGRIISISTGATVGGTAGGAMYCGTKAAVEQFTRALARELGPRHITVNTVSPGFTNTEMFQSLPHLAEIAVAMSPLGRVGEPEDIANVVAFLCSDQGKWITGQNIQAGGGVSMM